MTDDPDNLVLEILRAIWGDIAGIRSDIRDIKTRQTDMSRTIAGIRRDQADDAEVSAHVQARLDRLQEEVDRINRRLDIVDG